MEGQKKQRDRVLEQEEPKQKSIMHPVDYKESGLIHRTSTIEIKCRTWSIYVGTVLRLTNPSPSFFRAAERLGRRWARFGPV